MAVLAAGLCAAPGPGARAQAIGQGFELERAGRFAEAARVYIVTLRADPASLAALLGLERVLPPLGRLRELLPLARGAVVADPGSSALRAVELRTYAGLNELDSVAAVALRWAEAQPRDEAPFREWAVVLEDQRLYAEARRVLVMGRRAVGRATALALELAGLAQRAGEWETAAREWAVWVTATPDQLPHAALQLTEAPHEERERVVRVLSGGGAAASIPARRLAAELLLGWGEPQRAWAILEGTLDPPLPPHAPSPEAASALRRFADRAAALATPGARRLRGVALSRLADLVPPPVAARVRADAARAFLDAGDGAAARAMLERITADSTAPAVAQAVAQAALLEVLIEGGQLEAAGARLAALAGEGGRGSGEGAPLPGDDLAALRLALARAWLERGELVRADSVLAGDSSVAALALQGWIALYRGELREAAARFRLAGPFAGDRSDATDRTAMLALVQQIPDERVPELGAALLLLARGDSSAAATALRRAADRLSAAGGRPDVLLLAGQVAARGGRDEQTAAALFAEVIRIGGTGAAPPAAELEWAKLLSRQGRSADAVAHLEHLILTYPTSALVPEARRELERTKGAIPRS